MSGRDEQLAGPAVAGGDPISGVLTGADVGGRVMRGGAQRAFGFVLSNLLTVAGAVLLTRHLGVEDFGRFGTVMALLAVVQGLADAGLTATGAREMSLLDEPAERRELLSHILGLRVLLTAVGVALAVLFAVVAGYDATLVRGTLIAGVGIFLVSVQSSMLLPLAVEMRNGTIALNEVVRQLVLVIGWAALVVAGAALSAFFAVQIAAGIALLALTPLMLARHHFVVPSWESARIRELASIALPMALAGALGIIYFRVLVVLMSLMSDSDKEVGYYVASARVMEAFTALPVLLVAVVIPVVTVAARDNNERLLYVTARMTEVMALAGVLIAVMLSIGAQPVVVAIAGHDFEPAADVLRIQCLGIALIFVAAAFGPPLIGLGRIRELALATGLGVVAVVIAGIALIPAFDATGAAVAAVIADVVLCTATYAVLRRAGPGRALDIPVLARILLAGLLGGSAAALPGLPDVVLALIGALVFVVAALALRAVPQEVQGVARAVAAWLGRGGGSAGGRGTPDTLR